MPVQEEMKLTGYVIVNSQEGVARLLYGEFRITQNWFPIGQCIEYCIENGVTDPKVYTQEEFIKILPREHIDELPQPNQ